MDSKWNLYKIISHNVLTLLCVFYDKIPSRLDVAKEITKDLIDKILLLHGSINFVCKNPASLLTFDMDTTSFEVEQRIF